MANSNSFTTKARKLLTSTLFLLVFGSCFSIMLTVAYASLGPTPQERFITLSTTGSDNTTRSLYPSSSSIVGEGDSFHWNIQTHNGMGEAEYLALRVKILNATQFGPDEVRHLPSPVNHIYEERFVLAVDESITIPLAIMLKDTEVLGDGSSEIKSIIINGKDIAGLGIANDESRSFRFVIELWRYDAKFESFVYTWSSGPENESAWNQIRIQLE